MRSRRRFRRPVPPPDDNRARINEKIRIPQVRLIDQEGNQVGVVEVEEARSRAREADMDLVEVAPDAKPPVCRIMDYGKFLYLQQKKDRAARKKQNALDMKEVRLRPGTDQGDLEVKAKSARVFLRDGHKVGLQLRFRGREQAHADLGVDMIHHFAEMLDDVAVIESEPRREGRRMNAVLAPKKKN